MVPGDERETKTLTEFMQVRAEETLVSLFFSAFTHKVEIKSQNLI